MLTPLRSAALKFLRDRKTPDWPTQGPLLASIYTDSTRAEQPRQTYLGGERTTENARRYIELIQRADKYVLSLSVLFMADELVPYMFPIEPVDGDSCWVEWTEPYEVFPNREKVATLAMVGVLVVRSELDPSTAIGRVILHSEEASFLISFAYWFDAAGELSVDIRNLHMQNQMPFVTRVIYTAAAALELIRHPRAVAKERHPESQKTVRAKGRLVKERRDAWTEVLVHVTREEREAGDEHAGPGHSGIRKRMHHVRPFGRTRLGKPELVVGHWRGDPRLGVLPPRPYKVVP